MMVTHWGRGKLSAICRKHFQMHFLEWKCSVFDSNFTDFFSVVICQYWLTKQVTSHLNQWWSSLLTHIYVTWPQSLVSKYQIHNVSLVMNYNFAWYIIWYSSCIHFFLHILYHDLNVCKNNQTWEKMGTSMMCINVFAVILETAVNYN